MESIEFINRYELYLDEISEVVKPELLAIIDELNRIESVAAQIQLVLLQRLRSDR